MSRVTSMMVTRNVLGANQANLNRVASLQHQLATGKRLAQLSDDPISGRRAMTFRVQYNEMDRYLANIDKTLAFQQASESAVTGMVDIAEEAKALALKATNGSEDAASRSAMARTMDGLLQRMVDLGNATHDGRYIFAGTAVFDKPFDLTADGNGVLYQGDQDDFQVSISKGNRATVNLNGAKVFQQDHDVFKALIDVRNAMAANDPEAVEEHLAALDGVHAHLGDTLGALGSSIRRVELTQQQIEAQKVNLSELISKEEDVDLAETISRLQMAETTLEAGLNAGARVLRPTLLDYI
ncbi:MAG: flagellar hook-associated protein 3 [Planctomycetota bacterium]|nr:MAG: flagellar hook-associated protein 3 [Planctomycetota bacterium]